MSRSEFRWWWPLAALWEFLEDSPLLLLGLVFVVMVGGAAWVSYAANPCAKEIEGDVQVVGPAGAPAVVHESWCVEFKPGRAPEGGLP